MSRKGFDRFKVKLRRSTELVVAIRRTTGEGGEELRAEVLADVKDALAGGVATLGMIEVEGESEPQACVSVEDVFRAVLAEVGIDRLDMHAQESIFAFVPRAVDNVLAWGDREGTG